VLSAFGIARLDYSATIIVRALTDTSLDEPGVVLKGADATIKYGFALRGWFRDRYKGSGRPPGAFWEYDGGVPFLVEALWGQIAYYTCEADGVWSYPATYKPHWKEFMKLPKD
jgi:hypothetical protein